MASTFSVGDTVRIIPHDVKAQITQLVNSPRGKPKTLYQCRWVEKGGKVITTYFNDGDLELVKAAES